jgi:hypothetical protein
MFLLRAFDTYMVAFGVQPLTYKCNPQGRRQKLKYHTTFCIKQQPLGNTCSFYVCLNMVAFGVQPNCGVSVSAFILLYCRHL